MAAFHSATGQEANGIEIDNVATNPFFVDEASGDYQLKPGPSNWCRRAFACQYRGGHRRGGRCPVNLGVLTW